MSLPQTKEILRGEKSFQIPSFLYGTAWKEARTQPCVIEALRAGFRGIDTANQRKHYYEAGVGAALLEAYEAGLVTREELFLQTKFTHRAGQDERLPYDWAADLPTQVRQSFRSSLEHLHTDYLDSYVLHGPSLRRGLSDEDWAVWRTMEQLQQEGKVRSLGASNVSLDQLRLLCEKGSVQPSFVQNRCFASRGWDREVREYCRQNSVLYQGFSLLTANQEIFLKPCLNELLARHRCSAAQLVFAFALGIGMIALTGTSNVSHMREDLALFDLELALSPEDLLVIEEIAET